MDHPLGMDENDHPPEHHHDDDANNTDAKNVVSMKTALFSLDDDFADDDDDFEDAHDDTGLFGRIGPAADAGALLGGSMMDGGSLFMTLDDVDNENGGGGAHADDPVPEAGGGEGTAGLSSLPGVSLSSGGAVAQQPQQQLQQTFYTSFNDPLGSNRSCSDDEEEEEEDGGVGHNGAAVGHDRAAAPGEASSSAPPPSSSSPFQPLSNKFQSLKIPSVPMASSTTAPTTPTLPWSPSPSAATRSASSTAKEAVAKTEGDDPSSSSDSKKYVYGKVQVAHPVMVETKGLFGKTTGAYWTYEIRTKVNEEVVSVRRRFREIVALEDRLRASKPAIILPPRPEKQSTKALEEGHLRQSHDFAKHRTKLLQHYLADLTCHPHIGGSCTPDLHAFLTFPEDLGLAWPECSSSTLTRMGAKSTSFSNKMMAKKTAASTAAIALIRDIDDPDSELTTLVHSERVRMEKVHQAMPKIEATLSVMKGYGDWAGLTGMELSKVVKDVKERNDGNLARSIEQFGKAILRNGRRVRKLVDALEEGAMYVLDREHRRAKNELLAFEDRKKVLTAMTIKQQKANKALTKLEAMEAEADATHKTVTYAAFGGLARVDNQESMREEVKRSDEEAMQALREAEQIGVTLKGEIFRLMTERRMEWLACVKNVAHEMMVCSQERADIWQEAYDKLQIEGNLATKRNNLEPDEI